MKTYLVKYPGHTVYVQADSAEEAFMKCTHAKLEDFTKDKQHAHFYTVEEAFSINNAVRAMVGGLCALTALCVLVVVAALGVFVR